MMEPYSVLMSVYAGERAERLRESLESMLRQSAPADEIVLVCDGPLTEELEAEIGAFPGPLRLVRLPENCGLGTALNAGLNACRNELIARMDSDDVSVSDRCMRELAAFETESGLSMVGGGVAEFERDVSKPFACRRPPETQAEIEKYARRRNPFNHPTVMYRKSAVLRAGGYRPAPLHEDYDLWVRMLRQGARVRNLPQILVYMRVDEGLYRRRGGREYMRTMTAFHRKLYQTGFCSAKDYLVSAAAYRVSCLVPAKVRKTLYRALLRGKTT